MAAEEAKDPTRTIPRAYISGILTLVVLAIGVMLMAGGAGDWRKLADINDPLPQAMKMIVGEHSNWMHMLVWIGLFGLIASFHGIILGYSRQFLPWHARAICRLLWPNCRVSRPRIGRLFSAACWVSRQFTAMV